MDGRLACHNIPPQKVNKMASKRYTHNGIIYYWKELLAISKGKQIVMYYSKDTPTYELVVSENEENGSSSVITITESQYVNLPLIDLTERGTLEQWSKWMYRRYYKGLCQFRDQIEFADLAKSYSDFDAYVEFLKLRYGKEPIAGKKEVDYWSLHYN
jgi:hypothetical protein